MSAPEPPPEQSKENRESPSREEVSQRLETIRVRIDELERDKLQNPAREEKKGKDRWDKADIISKFVGSIIGSVLIAGMGLYFTHKFNDRQMESNRQQKERDDTYRENQVQLNKIQAIGQLAPMLTGSNRRQVDVGILLVNELTNDLSLLRHLARELKDQGAAKAIITLSNSEENPKKKKIYESILKELHVYEADPGETIQVAVEPRIADKNLTVEFAGHRLRHKAGSFTIKLSRKTNQTYYLKLNFPLPVVNPSPYSITFKGDHITKRDLFETDGRRALYTTMFVVD